MQFERVKRLISEEHFNKIKTTKILLVGIGGVGGYILEHLVRSGFENITIIDKDIVDITNLNRQIISDYNSVGKDKVNVAKKRYLGINKDLNLTIIKQELSSTNISSLEPIYDYIIDACDMIDTKYALIEYSVLNKIKIISSMGMANRYDASKIKMSKLNKTFNDPLARKLRNIIKDNHKNYNPLVVFSEELSVISNLLGSLSPVVSIPGALIVSYIINEIRSK